MKEVSRLPDLDITGCPPLFITSGWNAKRSSSRSASKLRSCVEEGALDFDTAVLVEGANLFLVAISISFN